MDSIITYLLLYNQYLVKTIYKLVLFISKNIPLNQWTFDDSNSPEYQKFKVDKLPKIIRFGKVDYQFLLAYYKHKYNKVLKPVQRRNGKSIPSKVVCPKCGASHHYIYDNNGDRGQFKCSVCDKTFNESNYATKPIVLVCPYCGHTLTQKKDRKHFRIHKCTNFKCSYYLDGLKRLPSDIKPSEKYKYKLHYIYREFTVDFFKMDLRVLSKRAINFNFQKFNPHIMGLCLTYHSNYKRSLRASFYIAIEDDCVRKNPFDFQLNTVIDDDTVPKVALTAEQEEKLLSFAKADKTYSKNYDEILILLKTGLRISEFGGLTLPDLDFENRLIKVDHQLLRDTENGYYIETPKTKSGELVEEAYQAFQRVLTNRKNSKCVVIDGYSNFLFLNGKGYPKVASDYNGMLRNLVKKYNKYHEDKLLHITPHILLHSILQWQR